MTLLVDGDVEVSSFNPGELCESNCLTKRGRRLDGAFSLTVGDSVVVSLGLCGSGWIVSVRGFSIVGSVRVICCGSFTVTAFGGDTGVEC